MVREFTFWEGRDVTVMSLHARKNLVLEQPYDSEILRFAMANILRSFPLRIHEKLMEIFYRR